MWVDIPNIAWYEASDDGHIRNKKTGRVLREFVGKDGYLRTQFAGKTRTVHRVIATTFIDKTDKGREYINHKDGNKQNNRAENLEWCTLSENMHHAYTMGLKSSRGTANGRSRLTVDDVQFVRAHYIARDWEYGAKALAKRFKVAPQTICAVAHGQNWVDSMPYFVEITGVGEDA